MTSDLDTAISDAVKSFLEESFKARVIGDVSTFMHEYFGSGLNDIADDELIPLANVALRCDRHVMEEGTTIGDAIENLAWPLVVSRAESEVTNILDDMDPSPSEAADISATAPDYETYVVDEATGACMYYDEDEPGEITEAWLKVVIDVGVSGDVTGWIEVTDDLDLTINGVHLLTTAVAEEGGGDGQAQS